MRFKRTKWGWWYVLLDRKHFKLKILKFRRDGACSLQYHKHRYELWLFLKGEGAFRRDRNYEAIGAGDYKSVGRNVTHKYYAKKPTTVLEIQYGPLCDEADIVRI